MKINKSLLLIDPDFDSSNPTACNLVVKIGVDSFSYAIIDHIQQRVIALYDEQEYNFSFSNLAERFETNNHLKLPFKQTKITIYSSDEISIPNEIFTKNSIAIHSKFIKGKVTINSFESKYFGFTTIFGCYKPLQQTIYSQLSNVNLYPQYTGLLKLAENTQTNQLFLDFSAKSFTALYITDEKVIAQKSFEIEDSQDFNYFVLLLIDQLAIDTANTILSLNGIIHLDDDKYVCLKKYFKKIEFVKIESELNLTLLEDMPTHYFNILLAIDQCE